MKLTNNESHECTEKLIDKLYDVIENAPEGAKFLLCEPKYESFKSFALSMSSDYVSGDYILMGTGEALDTSNYLPLYKLSDLLIITDLEESENHERHKREMTILNSVISRQAMAIQANNPDMLAKNCLMHSRNMINLLIEQDLIDHNFK